MALLGTQGSLDSFNMVDYSFSYEYLGYKSQLDDPQAKPCERVFNLLSEWLN
jgi:hypothetical protein